MDEKMFEQRLNQLKKGYQEIPLRSDSNQLLERVKESNQPIKRRFPFHFPYVASIIGVLLIGGLLGAQMLSTENGFNLGGFGKDEASVVTQDNINHYSKKLDQFYQERLAGFQEDLSLATTKELPFVIEAAALVDGFKQSSPEVYASENNLKAQFDDTKQKVERKLMTPEQELTLFIKRGKDATDEEMYTLLEKQEALQTYLQKQWEPIYLQTSKEVKSEMDDELFIKMILTDQVFEGTDLRSLTDKLVKNGYTFRFAEGMSDVVIDYEALSMNKKVLMSEHFRDYLEVLDFDPVLEGELIVHVNKISEFLSRIELLYVEEPSFIGMEKLSEKYQWFFEIYTGKIPDGYSIYDTDHLLKADIMDSYVDCIENYGNTISGSVIKTFYERLKANNFERVEPPLTPKLIPGKKSNQLPETNKQSVIENESIVLTADLEYIYNQYKQKKNPEVLEGLRPFDVMRIYMFASDQGDFDTTYSMYDQMDISKEQYISERKSKTSYVETYGGMTRFTQKYIDDTFVITFDTEEEILKDFRLKELNGIWKVIYIPMQ